MSFFSELSKALTPHTDKLGQQLQFHLAAIHQRLEKIEQATSDLGRGDIGNKWQRFVVKRKFLAAENFEVGTCPINEIWLIEAIASDGVQEKSPAFIVLANEVLLASVGKELIANEKYGSNQVVLPGEILSITARTEAPINCTITIIRRPIPQVRIPVDYGENSERVSPKAIHDPVRDELVQRIPDLYGPREPAGATNLAPTEGRTEQDTTMTRRQ